MEEIIDKKNSETLTRSKNNNGVIGDLQQLSEESWEEICEYRRLLDAIGYQKCLLELERIKNEQLR